jgi:hypothetical protein
MFDRGWVRAANDRGLISSDTLAEGRKLTDWKRSERFRGTGLPQDAGRDLSPRFGGRAVTPGQIDDRLSIIVPS